MAKPQGEKSATFPPVAGANRVKEALGINDLGGAMLRLTFLLCSGLFLVMLLGGRDFGQLRPGLALAAADAKAAAVVPVVETVALADKAVAIPLVVAAAVPEPVAVAAPPVVIVVPVAVVADVAPVLEAAEPENTVFTLSTFADPALETSIATEQATKGEIWYVSGNSLNVRSGPSTDDAVVGKLSRGEAMLVVAREGEDWAQIRIEGDGIDGYVAMRFLTPNLPVVN